MPTPAPAAAPELRRIDPTDATTIAAVLALNEHWVPHVGSISVRGLAALLAQSDLALAAVGASGSLDGFMILMAPGADYPSPNYRFFQNRLDEGVAPGPFRYVDRIAVDPSAQGSGVGRALYQAAFVRAASAGAAEVTCEVNVEPPNPDSQAFHARLGFVEVARQWTYDDTVEVQLLARPL